MWWLVFTAADLYIGIVCLDVMSKSGAIEDHKLKRLAVAKKICIGLLVITLAMVAVKLAAALNRAHGTDEAAAGTTWKWRSKNSSTRARMSRSDLAS